MQPCWDGGVLSTLLQLSVNHVADVFVVSSLINTSGESPFCCSSLATLVRHRLVRRGPDTDLCKIDDLDISALIVKPQIWPVLPQNEFPVSVQVA